MSRMLVVAGFLFTLGGCVTPQEITAKDEVTLDNAFKTIACGLATYGNELSRLNINTGGIQDSVEITLNLKASATGSNQLVVDAKPSISGFSAVDIGYTGKIENVSSRENNIKLTFTNIYTAKLNKPGEAQATKAGFKFADPPSMQPWFDKPCADRSASVPSDWWKSVTPPRR